MDRLEFVTVETLLAYGEMLARRTAGEGIALPPIPSSSVDRPQRTRNAMEKIRAFLQCAQGGFPGAEEYRSTRRALIEEDCHGDELVFFAAWNTLLAAGELAPLFRVPIGSVQKPTHRRPVAIVPRAQLTPQLVEDRIVLDLGEGRFWLLPRDLTGRTLLFTMRHGISRVESGTYRVGRRLANVLDPERGVPKADAVGAALARMLGVVGQQLDFLRIHNYLNPCTFVHLVSQSPNTRQLYERVISALMQEQVHHTEVLPPACDPALDSQDFGWVTGLEKKVEAEEAAKAFGVDVQTAKRLLKHPFYSYPGGHSFFDVYVDIVDGFRRLGQSHQGKAVCLYSHSSTLRALMIYLDPRPFREAFTEFGEYKEGQDNVVLLTYEQGLGAG
jgi:6-phosphofructokinase 1